MTFKLFQTGSETRRNALPFFTKALPRSEVFCGVAGGGSKNLPDMNQYLGDRMQNQFGPEQRANAARPYHDRVGGEHGIQ